MPVQYAGIIDEHMAVRERAGLFDVSHMGEVFVRGPHATPFLQHLLTNDVHSLYDGRALYSVMCHEDGGIVDDLLAYRLGENEYMLVVNAANREKDLAWMIQNNPAKADIEDASDKLALIAIQGPRSAAVVERAFDIRIEKLKYYHFRPLYAGPLANARFGLLSRTGYTGERGYEIYCDADAATSVWEALMQAGKQDDLHPCGLGARDTLRIEAGFCLYGHDITDETNPLEAGLGWLTKLDTDDFIGRNALMEIREATPERRLAAFVLRDRGIPRQGYKILSPEGAEIGEVTSGTQSPVLQQGIGLGYVKNNPAYTKPGSPIGVAIRSRTLAAEVRKPPLHSA